MKVLKMMGEYILRVVVLNIFELNFNKGNNKYIIYELQKYRFQ